MGNVDKQNNRYLKNDDNLKSFMGMKEINDIYSYEKFERESGK